MEMANAQLIMNTDNPIKKKKIKKETVTKKKFFRSTFFPQS